MEYPWRRDRSSSCPEIGNYEDHRSRVGPGLPIWDLQLAGFRPRLIDFEAECDFEPVNTPVHRNIDSRRGSWICFPDDSPTQANSISSSIPSIDEDVNDDSDDFQYNDNNDHESYDNEFELHHNTQRHMIELRSGQQYPRPVQIGLRVFTGKKGVDTPFGTRIIRNIPKPTATTQKPSIPIESIATSVESTSNSLEKGRPPQQIRDKDGNPKVDDTRRAGKVIIQRQNFLVTIRNFFQWSRDNSSVVLFILLSWLTMFILAQTRALRVDTWELLGTQQGQKDRRFYPSADSDWRPDPKSIVDLFFSKNSSQTILDAKIIYHLESIGERQGRLHDRLQSQLDSNAIVLDFMLQEMRNLKSAFSAISDRRKTERQIDKLKDDIKQCNQDMLSRTTHSPIIIKQRPTYTVTKMTKTVIRQHYITPRSQPTVSTKVIFYPQDRMKLQQTNQPDGASGTSAPLLTDKDVDKIAQRFVELINSASKGGNPGSPWWDIFPSFSGVGQETERRITKQLESIVQLLCPKESGLSADSLAFRTRKCFKRRQSVASVLQPRMQSTVPNRILSAVVKFSDDLPPIGLSFLCGAIILFYGPPFTRWIGKFYGDNRNKKTLRGLTICISILNVIIWPTKLATIWIRYQEKLKPLRRLPWESRLLAAARCYLVAVLEKIPRWLPYPLQDWWQSLDLIGRLQSGSGVHIDRSSKVQYFFQRAGSFGRYITLRGIENIVWISVPYIVIKCSVLLAIFVFVTRGLPAIRSRAERIRIWISRSQKYVLAAPKQISNFWQRNRFLFTNEGILGLPQLLGILFKQTINSSWPNFSLSFRQEGGAAQQWAWKIGGIGVSVLRLSWDNNIVLMLIKNLEMTRAYAFKAWGSIQTLISTTWNRYLLLHTHVLRQWGTNCWALLQAPFSEGVFRFLGAMRKICGYICEWTLNLARTMRENRAQALERMIG
ncbi:hypothetical protein TWF192_008257 [Orbilia oligospora]|uniref:Uncharacterized protein n=1 Tax=Orbilia oligospora TaxID=2813651 RepID=A0A6G1MKE5_ORBOL|nr:hypothetical protein TWF191_000028 [Orbilia oligospora]KAF3261801.1 hypothetical protein TWF192_008257 [Orbilia oligospora]